MARIFISHSHSDEAIAYKLVNFLLAALGLQEKEILCTSNPDQGLTYGSSSITDQLKNQLKNSEALIVLITSDSLHSAWIPFEAGSFWTTDKPIIPILGPSLTQNDLPGPLKSFLSIPIDVRDVEDRINNAINQLAKSLNLQQEVTRRRNYTLQEFSDSLRAWQSKRPVSDQSQEIEKLKAQIVEIKATSQKEKEKLERSFQSKIEQLKEQLAQARSQAIQAQDFIVDLGKEITLEMIAIPGGKFLMGTEDQEIERLCKEHDVEFFRAEKSQHEVTIQPFYMSKYPVTQAQYQTIMSNNPSDFKGDNRPVEQVVWDEAVEFCQKLSKQRGKEYRLPTEAEWEYACRSVISYQSPVNSKEWNEKYHQPFYFGEVISSELANYGKNIGETTDVGKYRPNAFGLYDMHGLVCEWCQDDWHDDYNDVKAWVLGERITAKVMRGGSWELNSYFCRSACRLYYQRFDKDNNLGFRVACTF